MPIILVFSVRMPTGIYEYLFQDAYSVILVFINTSVKVLMSVLSVWHSHCLHNNYYIIGHAVFWRKMAARLEQELSEAMIDALQDCGIQLQGEQSQPG